MRCSATTHIRHRIFYLHLSVLPLVLLQDDDIEALRLAALATLKPKVSGIFFYTLHDKLIDCDHTSRCSVPSLQVKCKCNFILVDWLRTPKVIK
jgi:hypothetical protein